MANSQTSVLLYGGTGQQGRPIAQQLSQAGYQVRILTRQPDKHQDLNQLGIELILGDLGNKESLKIANQGIDLVVLLLPTEINRERGVNHGQNAIDAAKEAGVNLVVFNTSGLTPPSLTGVNTLDIKWEVEQYLKQSYLPWMIVQPTIYLGNLMAPWTAPAIVKQGVLAYPLPAETPASWISWEDNAKFTLAAMAHPEYANSVFQVGGSEQLTGLELAEQFSHVLAQPVSYFPLSLSDYETGLNQAAGFPLGSELASLYRWFAAQQPSPLAVDVEPAITKLGVVPTSLSAWIKAQDWQALATIG